MEKQSKKLQNADYEIGKKYYKYMSLQNIQRIIDVFKNNHLFASKYNRLNDPMEGYFISRENMSRSIIEQVRARKSDYRICSLTQCDTSILMWAHYSKGFTGVVIGLSAEENVYPIKYGKLKELNHFCENQIEDITSIFLHKMKEWEYEKESRIVLNNCGEFAKILPIEVIFGLRTDKTLKQKLMDKIRELNRDIIFKQQNINFENITL